ncbi:hypothetical protein A2U01_0013924, partial [Trifolium medium]|nr:hypothetical protein [Trifolium medium]
MAEDQPQPSAPNRRVVDLSWVADEPRTTVSVYADCEDDLPEDMFTDIQDAPENWEVRIPTSRRRICSIWNCGTIPMYELAFRNLGYKMPFTDLEIVVFRHLRLAPSQLHPNSLAFLRAFEITADHLGLQRSCPRGEKAKGKLPRGAEQPPSKFGWVSLKQRTRVFDMYEESVRGFKEVYY